MSQLESHGVRANQERLWDHLRVLCEQIGPRLSGTAGDERAVDYIAAHMRKCGADVEVQDYPCPGWECESAELTLLGAGGPEPLPAVAQTFSEGCDVEAELGAVGSEEELELAPDLDGKMLVLHGKIASRLTPDRNPLLLAAEERRAAGLIIVSPNESVPTKLVRDPFLRVPSVAVAQSVGQALLARQGTRLRLRVRARRYDSKSHNVIGRLPGERDGHVLVAAHYDTAADVPGASDNASGTAVVLELCELFAARRRSLGIHFIAYGAEEYGRRGFACLGAAEYVRRHPADVAQARGIIELDCVGTATPPPRVTLMGFGTPQRKDILGVLGQYPRCEVILRPEAETPHTPFDLTGVPIAWFVNDYPRVPIHTVQDSIDLLSPEEMAFAADVAAAVLHRLACGDVAETA
jgi:Iap family predicted aminopeptidase